MLQGDLAQPFGLLRQSFRERVTVAFSRGQGLACGLQRRDLLVTMLQLTLELRVV
jgi:hypothetical protein